MKGATRQAFERALAQQIVISIVSVHPDMYPDMFDLGGCFEMQVWGALCEKVGCDLWRPSCGLASRLY
eukprot:5629224-Pleurochrysis_carterae.AAC.2